MIVLPRASRVWLQVAQPGHVLLVVDRLLQVQEAKTCPTLPTNDTRKFETDNLCTWVGITTIFQTFL